jgi:uncharacterized protein YheU (UPF0270 family)
MSESDDGTRVTEVPSSALKAEVLRALIEEFVTRDGTDYGDRERSLEEKVEDVRRQLESGDARIVFDPEAETVNIVVSDPPMPAADG